MGGRRATSRRGPTRPACRVEGGRRQAARPVATISLQVLVPESRQHFLETQLWPCLLQQSVELPQIGAPPQALGEKPCQTARVTHDPCAAASGETIDSITGRRREMPATRRRVRSIPRREYWALSAGSVTGSLSKCARLKRSSAIHTTASSFGAANCSSSSAATSATLVRPSQCR